LHTAAVIEKENINKKIESAMFEQSNKIEEFINNGSNWGFFLKQQLLWMLKLVVLILY
jgi:hypothetical protein